MRIGGSKSEATVEKGGGGDCPLQVVDELLPHLKELKYVGVFITSGAPSGGARFPPGLDNELKMSGAAAWPD